MSVVTGVFQTIEGAEDTTKALLDAGYTDDDIGVVVRDTQKGTVIADDLGREYASGATPRGSSVMSRTTVWDRFPDNFDETMRRDGLPDDALSWYQQRLDGGDVLMVVNAGDRRDDVMRIMRDHGGNLYGRPTGMETTTRPTTTTTAGTATEEYRVPVIDEELVVEKTRHEVGEVRVTSEVTREMVEIPATVVHDEVRVERRMLDHPMTPDEYQGRKVEGEVCLPIVEEEVHVVKRPVVRSEMVITRVPVAEQQTLRETVTHTEPHVERTGMTEAHKEEPGEEHRAA